METRKSHFEDHLNIVNQPHTKTAGVKDNDILAKLAAELGIGKTADDATGVSSAGAPVAEGEVTPAQATPAGANPAVVAATDAVAIPQTTVSGGNPAEAAAGDVPAGLLSVTPIISDGTGTVINANELNKVDAAVEAATRGAGGEQVGELESAAVLHPEAAEAMKVGQLIAQSFQQELNKMANDQEYVNAINILSSNGLLDGYQINDMPELDKTASVNGEGLDKIASNKPLSRNDIISAAYELVELEKQAELAEEQGREQARQIVEFVTKIAEDAKEEAKQEGETEGEEKKENEEKKEPEESGSEEKKEEEKVSSLMKNPQIVAAVRTLKSAGLL